MKTDISILAAGADIKNSVGLSRDGDIFMSEPAGNLEELSNYLKFKKTISRLLKEKPDLIACDLHPEYFSTKYMAGLDFPVDKKVYIQHHHAHIASCILENNIKTDVIGVAFDGTGYGLDQKIWGGEFFTGNLKSFYRYAHLEYCPLASGEGAITQPWRSAASWLYKAYGQDFLKIKNRFTGRFKKSDLFLIKEIIDKKINAPLTSSMGRLFDAVSSLVGLCDIAGYEAQAAIELENILDKNETGAYKFDIIEQSDNGCLTISPNSLIKSLINDANKGVSAPKMSSKFHNAIVNMVRDVCLRAKKEAFTSKVCLSGGVFANKYLLTKSLSALKRNGFNVYTNKTFPVNDRNIAVGQIAIASNSEK